MVNILKFSSSIIQRTAFALLLASSFCGQSFAADAIKDYSILKDKISTDTIFRPFLHEFFIDIQSSVNKGAIDLYRDIQDVSKDTSTQEQVLAINNLTTNYMKTQHYYDAQSSIGIPLPAFWIGKVRVLPDLRIQADISGVMLIDRRPINNYLELVPNADSSFLIDAFAKIGQINAGDDIGATLLKYEGDHPGSFSPKTLEWATKNQGKFLIPDVGDPTLTVFSKNDIRIGPHTDIMFDNQWNISADLYAMMRTDKRVLLTATTLVKNRAAFNQVLGERLNTQTTANADLAVSQNTKTHRLLFSVEEIKLLTINNKIETAGPVLYGYPVLVRFQADKIIEWKPSSWASASFVPFIGIHYRNLYSLVDGLYGGSYFKFGLLEKFFEASLKFMVDSRYITLAPDIKFWLFVLECSLRSPLIERQNGFSISPIYTLDLRLRVEF